MAPPPVSKKRKLAGPAAEKIEFDFSAREEYLTGFHKRKVARMKHAQEENAKREKEEKLRFRREVRKILSAQSSEQRTGIHDLD
jgi:ribosomal RNA-processing protein 17